MQTAEINTVIAELLSLWPRNKTMTPHVLGLMAERMQPLTLDAKQGIAIAREDRATAKFFEPARLLAKMKSIANAGNSEQRQTIPSTPALLHKAAQEQAEYDAHNAHTLEWLGRMDDGELAEAQEAVRAYMASTPITAMFLEPISKMTRAALVNSPFARGMLHAVVTTTQGAPA